MILDSNLQDALSQTFVKNMCLPKGDFLYRVSGVAQLGKQYYVWLPKGCNHNNLESAVERAKDLANLRDTDQSWKDRCYVILDKAGMCCGVF